MEPPKELVFSYFAGQATSVQQKVIGEWLAQSGSSERYFQWLDEWERAYPQYTPNVTHHMEQFRQRLKTPVHVVPQPIRPLLNESGRRWYSGRWLVAASLTIPLLVSGWFFRDSMLYTTVLTGSHQLRTIKLPDGSTVALNSRSTLRVPRIGYGWLSRRVALTGDAVFDVKHLPNNEPFVVQATDGLAVEVLGTEFSVRSANSHAEVVLKRGRVNLHYSTDDRPAQNLLMKPGDRVTLDGGGTLQLQKQPDTTQFAQWRYRSFSFNNTTLREVANQIQYVFGVTVQLSDPVLARRTLTGTIRAGSSDELADALAELLGLRVSHRGQHLIFSTASESQLTQ